MRRRRIGNAIAQNLQIPHIHEWIKVKLLNRYMAFVILLIILKFGRVGRYFLMRYSGFEASMDSVRGNLSHDTFICAEFAAFPGKGCDLHPILLNYTVHTLLIDRDSLLSEFSMYAAITIVFVYLPDLSYFPEEFCIRISTLESLLSVHIRSLWKTNGCENVL